MSLLAELQRRNVFRVTAAYLVVGWLLTEVLTTILPTLGAPAWTSRAVILAFALGFVPTVILSWIYELTPQGIKRESDIVGDGNTRGSNRRFDYAAIAIVGLLILGIAFLGARTTPTDRPGTATVSNASVAVLPFVNMSDDKDNEYFSDGLTETLLHMLTQVPGLQVAARTSSFAFKGQNQNVQEIAAALKVAHILEGSVQRAGNRVRITAQLIRATDGFHVWSSIYDRTFEDIFDIQDEIAAKVGSELSESIFGTDDADTARDDGFSARGAGTEFTDAYDLYLQALGERATYSYRGLQASENLLKGALAIDPGYLGAKTELASNYLHQFETGLISETEARSQIIALTDQVLVAEPGNPGATAIRLYAQMGALSQTDDPLAILDAIPEFERLVAENPADYRIRMLLGRLLRSVRQLNRALEIQLDALRRDPFNAQIHYELGWLYVDLNNFEDARKSLAKSLEIEPRQPNAYVSLAGISRQNGDGVDYVRQLLQANAYDPQDHELPGFIATFLYRLGLVEEGDDFRDQVIAIAPTSDIAYLIELVRAANTGDEISSEVSARRAIEDDVSDRNFAFGGAIQYLLRSAVRNGTVAEESAYLDEVAPGLLDVDAVSLPAKYRMAQFIALDAWFTTLEEEELLRRIEKIQQLTAGFGTNALAKAKMRADTLTMRGQTEEAISVALDGVFAESVLRNLNWRESLALAQYKEVVADDRVQAAMRRWTDELASQTQQVKIYLADLSSAQ